MNENAEIAVDVRDAIKRYGDFTALQQILWAFVTMSFSPFWGHRAAGKQHSCA